jgi:hypothetical protein
MVRRIRLYNAEYARQYRAKNREKVEGWRRASRARHPERQRKTDRKYYNQNCDRINERRKQWRKTNRALCRECEQKYLAKHPRKYSAAKYMANKEKRNTPEFRSKAAAFTRRHMARKNGYAECTVFPSPPSDSRCDICSRVAKLVLDHDHETGSFRGYLCRDCNLGLGKLGDNLDGLRRVIAYLERARG